MKSPDTILLGGHVSASGGIGSVCAKAEEIGANCIQFFGGSPVRWNAPVPDDETCLLFKKERERRGVLRSFLHAPYLINLASEKGNMPAISRTLLGRHLEIAQALGVEGVIFHIGSRGGRDQAEAERMVADALTDILKQVLGSTLLIENSAGAGNLVGDQLDEVGRIMRMVDSPRLGFCLDTAHAFGAGILPEFMPERIASFISSLNHEIGIEKLWAVHLNDSKVAAGTNKDRHENIGEGYIGSEGFKNFLGFPQFRNTPLVLEVPGFEGKGPDKKNIDRVRSLL